MVTVGMCEGKRLPGEPRSILKIVNADCSARYGTGRGMHACSSSLCFNFFDDLLFFLLLLLRPLLA